MKRLREEIFEQTYMLFGHWILLEMKDMNWIVHVEDHARYFELGGMKPGPRSFSRLLCNLWRIVSNQTPFPSTLSYVLVEKSEKERTDLRERGRENWLILILPCIVFHGPLYTWRWGNVWVRKQWCPTW
jgi:hypothetical protein